jgi:hypothetical protein
MIQNGLNVLNDLNTLNSRTLNAPTRGQSLTLLPQFGSGHDNS